MRVMTHTVPALAIFAGFAAPLFAQRARAVPMKESWRLEAAQSVFRAPHSLVAFGECQVWVADAVAGLWRLGCEGGTPQLIGTQGLGQGEYQQPWELNSAGWDSVVLFDRALQRGIVYAADGAVVATREMRVPETSMGECAAIAYRGGVFRVWTNQFPDAADPGALRSLVLAFKSLGIAHDTLAAFAGLPSVYWGSSFGGSRLAVPHQRRPYIAFLPDGGFIAGSNDDARIVVFDAAGHELRAIALSLPVAQAVTNGDRDAYADSVRKITERDMSVLHYNAPERAKYRAQIDTYLTEDVSFPARRQLFDRLVIDARGEALWVLASGTGKNYARTWKVYDIASGELRRRVTVPHTGAVAGAAARDGSLYVATIAAQPWRGLPTGRPIGSLSGRLRRPATNSLAGRPVLPSRRSLRHVRRAPRKTSG